ncbi:MAG: helix-turn-helix transcriptional regulator [Pseudomonadota bacterium]
MNSLNPEVMGMLTHAEVWQAIDRLAANHKMSPSGLARRAGMDPTTFNRSKRTTKDGKDRWPSTESVAKILKATGSSLNDFIGLINGEKKTLSNGRVPLISQAAAAEGAHFDRDGMPLGEGWDEILFPHVGDEGAFALEITDSQYEPVFRTGDTVLVCPSASVRRGDRVALQTLDGLILIRQLSRQSALKIDLQSVNREGSVISLGTEQVRWMSRIIWSSQ